MKETTSHLVIETLETHVELCKQAKKKKKRADLVLLSKEPHASSRL